MTVRSWLSRQLMIFRNIVSSRTFILAFTDLLVAIEPCSRQAYMIENIANQGFPIPYASSKVSCGTLTFFMQYTYSLIRVSLVINILLPSVAMTVKTPRVSFLHRTGL